MTRAGINWIAALALGAVLAGCGADTDELQTWMDQQRREVKPSITPLTPPKRFDPAPYASLQAVEPFSNQKLLGGPQAGGQTAELGAGGGAEPAQGTA